MNHIQSILASIKDDFFLQQELLYYYWGIRTSMLTSNDLRETFTQVIERCHTFIFTPGVGKMKSWETKQDQSRMCGE